MKSQFMNKIYGIRISSSELCLEECSYILRDQGLKSFISAIGHMKYMTYSLGPFGLFHRFM